MKTMPIFLLLSLFIITACADETTTESAKPVCDTECRHSFVSDGIISVTLFLYNQNIAGRDITAPDMTVDCPTGGTAYITGSVNGDPETLITSVELDYELDDCSITDANYDLTFSGSVNRSGSFRSTGYSAVITRSDALRFAGMITVATSIEVQDNCSFSLSETGNDFDSTDVTGSMCGVTIDY